MIHIDSRVGSRELARYLPADSVRLTRLQYGDAMFLGNGRDGVPVTIGIELKTVGDLMRSIVDGRFSGTQLPGLLRDYHVVYLILEGRYRAEPATGLLQVPGGNQIWRDADFGAKRWMYRDLHGFLTTVESRHGVRLRLTYDRRESARVVAELYHWWVDKTWEEHRSACQFDTSGEPTLLPASLLRRVAAQLRGIGWTRAQAVEQHFSSVIDMILAPVEEWMRIPGIGKVVARNVVEDIWRAKHARRVPLAGN